VIELDALAAMHESVGTNAKCRDVRYTWLHRTKRADGARRSDRRRKHIAELNKRAAEADLRLKRLYDAIETGVADLGDPGLKERIAGLKAIRDQAQADTMRAQAVLDSAAQQPITTTVLREFAVTARKRMRIEGGGYRRDHLRALAQRVEVADREVRIMVSKSDLLRTLAAISGVKSDTDGIRSSVLDWRKGCVVNRVDFATEFLMFQKKATV
jgi:site-specific DNA recombinase